MNSILSIVVNILFVSTLLFLVLTDIKINPFRIEGWQEAITIIGIVILSLILYSFGRIQGYKAGYIKGSESILELFEEKKKQ